MPRGGLSNDPEKRKRQLAGLQKGNERARARLTELDAPPAPTADEPAVETGEEEPKPGSRRVPVGKVGYAKPGKDGGDSPAKPKGDRPAKPKGDRPAKKPVKPGKAEATAEPSERLPGFFDGLQLPSFRRRD